MEGCKGIFCRLCINPVTNTNFTLVDESIKEILRTISLNLDLDNKDTDVICSTCSVKLYSAFGFKSTCLYIEDKIVSYVNPKISFVDLREVYLEEYDNTQLITMENDQKICRLCLQLVNEGFFEAKLEMIHRYIPEVNFAITENPIVCGQCFDSLSTHVTFIKTCLVVETKTNICDNKMSHFEPGNILFKSENEEIELGEEQNMKGLVKIKQELETEEIPIKIEEVNVKSEGKCRERGSSLCNLHNETIENKMNHNYEDITEIETECIHICEVSKVQINKHEALDIPLCNSESSTCHQIIRKSRLYKCDMCTYETKHKGHLRIHQLTHVDPSDIQMYKCDHCTYETKYKNRLKCHQLTHKVASEIQMYKCDACDYEAKHKNYLKRHQLIHKNPSEIQMYRCDTCNFETKRNSHLKIHQLTHKDPSKIEMYKCDSCTYETKYKKYLNMHQLTHKDPSEIQMYKCDACIYETKHKNNLKRHELMHKDPSEVEMYKCYTYVLYTYVLLMKLNLSVV